MPLIGTVDLGNIDLGHLEGRDRGTLARVLGAKSYRDELGRWRFAGGVRDNVRLDHPSVLRILGEPLEAEAGTVRWEPGQDDVRGPAQPPEPLTAGGDWTPGPNLTAWFDSLACPLVVEYAADLINERMGGAPCAAVPSGLDNPANVRDTIATLARLDALEALDTTPAPPDTPDTADTADTATALTVDAGQFNDARVFLDLLIGTQARRAALVPFSDSEPPPGHPDTPSTPDRPPGPASLTDAPSRPFDTSPPDRPQRITSARPAGTRPPAPPGQPTRPRHAPPARHDRPHGNAPPGVPLDRPLLFALHPPGVPTCVPHRSQSP